MPKQYRTAKTEKLSNTCFRHVVLGGGWNIKHTKQKLGVKTVISTSKKWSIGFFWTNDQWNSRFGNVLAIADEQVGAWALGTVAKYAN